MKRGSLDPDTEIKAVRELSHDMSENEILGIYPEAPAPPRKLARAQEVIAERQPEITPMAARLNHLMPPRLGGPLALIDEATGGTDIVFCGHVGFDSLRTVYSLWHGDLNGQTIRLGSWRFSGDEIPEGEQAYTIVYDKWQMVDDWVGEQLQESSRPSNCPYLWHLDGQSIVRRAGRSVSGLKVGLADRGGVHVEHTRASLAVRRRSEHGDAVVTV